MFESSDILHVFLHPVHERSDRLSPYSGAVSVALHLGLLVPLFFAKFSMDAGRPAYTTTRLYQPTVAAPLPPSPLPTRPAISSPPPLRVLLPPSIAPQAPLSWELQPPPAVTRPTPAQPEILQPVAPSPTPVSPGFARVAASAEVAHRVPPSAAALAGFDSTAAAPASTATSTPRPQTGLRSGFGSAVGGSPSAPSSSPRSSSAGFGTYSVAGDRSSAAQGSTATAGFGAAATGAVVARSSSMAASSFGTAEATVPTAHPAGHRGVASTPLEILDKPRPVYTDEARAAKAEGEVMLEVLFGAAGTARVLRVVRALGFGLDRAAIVAAERIRFKHATDGKSNVDTIATVRIAFQLAY